LVYRQNLCAFFCFGTEFSWIACRWSVS
jgi:hypothetical protein